MWCVVVKIMMIIELIYFVVVLFLLSVASRHVEVMGLCKYGMCRMEV